VVTWPRRHPAPFELGAFFDGEGDEPTRAHVERCRRCQRTVTEMGTVRAAVRGELVAVATDRRAVWARRWPAAVLPVAAAVGLLLAVAVPGGLPTTRVREEGGFASAPPATTATDDAPAAVGDIAPVRAPAPVSRLAGPAAAVPPAPATPASPEAPAGPATASVSSSGAAGSEPVAAQHGPAAPAPARPGRPEALRLGVPVPTSGPLASEADEVLRAVRAVADTANQSGGIGGRPVDVVIVPTDDDVARKVSLSRVDALVGGFAMPAPAGLPWLVPADVAPGGPDVVAGEVSADQAGAVLGNDLAGRGLSGPAGVVVGAGPDAALADGLARSGAVERVTAAAGTGCDDEVAALRRKRVSALAIAGPPDLAQRCAEAAARVAWRPPGGLLLAPSAAYARLDVMLPAQGARTVLGFPSPRSDDPGAARYRRATSRGSSYRALVSFAAAELALEVTRQTGGVSAAPVRTGRWHSDLYDLVDGRNTSGRVVTARFGRWTTG
jgi:Periplasmic binding protein